MPAAPVTQSLLAVASLALLFGASCAGAQDAIKCKLPDGRTIYTDIGCPGNSAAGVVNTSPNSIDRSAERDTVARIYAEHGATMPGQQAPYGGGYAGVTPVYGGPPPSPYDDSAYPPSYECDQAMRELNMVSFRYKNTTRRTARREADALAQGSAEVERARQTADAVCGKARARERDKMAVSTPMPRHRPGSTFSGKSRGPTAFTFTNCSAGFCTDNMGNTYSRNGGTLLIRSDGKMCERNGIVINCPP